MTDLVDTLRGLKRELEQEGVERLILFGSRARGTAGADSDVDIAIAVRPDSRFSILDLVGVEQTISDRTGIPANAFMLRSLDPAFRQEIDRDGVVVF